MRVAQILIVVTVLVAPAVLSGCLSSVQGTRDWWANNGDIVVRLGTLPPDAVGQSVQDFETLKIAVVSVTVVAVGEVRAYAGVVYNPPLGIDLVMRQNDGKGVIVLKRESLPTKAIQKIEVKTILVEAKLKNGETVPACPTDGTPAEKKPCFAMPRAGAFVFERPGDPSRMQRSKTMIVDTPLAAIYSPKVKEYFLQARFAAEEAPITFE